MHAISSGLMSALDGGNFGCGFLSGMLSSAISSTITALGQTGEVGTKFDGKGNAYEYAKPNKFGDSGYFKAAIIVSGGLSGGIGASIAGGNFWKGVRQGLITSGLNHVAHLTTNFIISLKKSIVEIFIWDKVAGGKDVGHTALRVNGEK